MGKIISASRYWEQGGAQSPNSVRLSDGTRAVRGWWPVAEEFAVVSVSSASVPADPDMWDNNNEVTVSGSGPYAVRATVVDDRHYCHESDPTNDISSYCDIVIVATVAGSQQWVRVWAGTDWANIDLLNGATGDDSGATLDITVAVGSVTVRFRDSTVARDCRIELLDSDDSDATPGGYAGSTSDGLDITSVSLVQHRSSGVADQSLENDGTPRYANLQQADPAKQPLWGRDGWLDDITPPGSLNGRPILVQEAGRAVYQATAHAEVVGVASGTDPSFALVLLGSLKGSAATSPHWVGNDLPAVIISTSVRTTRGADTQTYSGVVAADLEDACMIAVVVLGTSRYLYVDDVLKGTATHTSQNVSMNSFRAYGRNSTAHEQRGAGVAVYALDGAKTHAQVHADLWAAHARERIVFGL